MLSDFQLTLATDVGLTVRHSEELDKVIQVWYDLNDDLDGLVDENDSQIPCAGVITKGEGQGPLDAALEVLGMCLANPGRASWVVGTATHMDYENTHFFALDSVDAALELVLAECEKLRNAINEVE